MTKKKRKYKKQKRYVTGSFVSTKMNTTWNYRSSWEKRCMELLEENADVNAYYYESCKIPFVDTKRKKPRVRNYIPDFLIEFSDGHKEMWEIKPTRFQTYKINLIKFDAAKKYCKKNGISSYRVLDLSTTSNLQKILANSK